MKPKVKSYLNFLKSGQMKTKKDQILKIIIDNPGITIDKIRDNKGLPHQTLTGIISVLMDDGVVYVSGEKSDENGKHYSRLYFESNWAMWEQREIIRLHEKFKAWQKNAENYIPFMGHELYNKIAEL